MVSTLLVALLLNVSAVAPTSARAAATAPSSQPASPAAADVPGPSWQCESDSVDPNGGQPCHHNGTVATATLVVGHRYTLTFHQVITGTSGSLYDTWAQPDDGLDPEGSTCHIGAC